MVWFFFLKLLQIKHQHTLSLSPLAITMVLQQKAHQFTKMQQVMDTYLINKQLQQAHYHTQNVEESCSNPTILKEVQVTSKVVVVAKALMRATHEVGHHLQMISKPKKTNPNKTCTTVNSSNPNKKIKIVITTKLKLATT